VSRSSYLPPSALELGGWDARYAQVLSLWERDGLGIAVIDTSGDGREIEADLFVLDSDGQWVEHVSGLGCGYTEDVAVRMRVSKAHHSEVRIWAGGVTASGWIYNDSTVA
jgi:hypothetical protein